MEIANPGEPLVETNRFLDSPPRSRNETLASFMRRVGVCEERGSGIDKVVFQAELYQLPAPLFEVAGDNTRATLYAHRPFTRMSPSDRIRACYLHACLRYVQGDPMTNSSLRGRFGFAKNASAVASRVIKDSLGAGAIRPLNPEAGKKFMKYVPSWA
jgi:ATP-dependent DNA helicase RecG